MDVASGGVTHLSHESLPPIADGSLRWLHVALADQHGRRLIAELPIAAEVRELLLSPDEHQRALVTDGTIACVVHDFAREFEDTGSLQTAALHFALTPSLMVTARHHPVRCADIVRHRIDAGAVPRDAPAALDLLISAMTGVIGGIAAQLTVEIQTIEDALLDEGREPGARELPVIRRRAVLAQRQLHGLHQVLHRLEQEEELPEPLSAAIARLVQRIAGLEGDVGAVQVQTRLLRDELDLRNAQRTNQNLYVLSVMSALILPATLVTGIFGMNTGGMPLTGGGGTALACFLVLGSALTTYVLLRLLGFFGNSRR